MVDYQRMTECQRQRQTDVATSKTVLNAHHYTRNLVNAFVNHTEPERSDKNCLTYPVISNIGCCCDLELQ